MKPFQNSNTKFALTAAVLVVSFALAACGGGGGSSPSTNTSTSGSSGGSASGGSTGGGAAPTVPANTTVPTPTYSANSVLKTEFFNDLNSARQAWNISLLAQNTDLDTSTQNHANYLAENAPPSNPGGIDPSTGLLYMHSEDQGNPGFYAATPQARGTLAGYTGGVGEIAIATWNSGTTVAATAAQADAMFNAFMMTVYHRANMLQDNYRDIGIGFSASENLVVDMGIVGQAASLPATTLNVFPLPNSVDNYPVWVVGAEAPNPVPSLAVGTLIASPVTVAAGYGHALTVTSFTLVDTNGANVSVQQVNAANDTEEAAIAPNMAHIIPLAKLNLGETYTATFVGAIDGTPVNKTWSFTTPAAVITGVTQTAYTMTAGTTLTVPFGVPSGTSAASYEATGSLYNATFTTSGAGMALTIPSGDAVTPVIVTITLFDYYYQNVSTTITVTVNP